MPTKNIIYSHTESDVINAFNQILVTLFDGKTPESGDHPPTILYVAGIQGAGKSHLLKHTLLPSGKYVNYINLYHPDYRKKHPQYDEMKKHGAWHVCEQTDKFIDSLCTLILKQALSKKYNIIMEFAFNRQSTNTFPAEVTKLGYQLEMHLINAKKELLHLSIIDRAMNSLKTLQPEKFSSINELETHVKNAEPLLNNIEELYHHKAGCDIFLYERGLPPTKNTQMTYAQKFIYHKNRIDSDTSSQLYPFYSKMFNEEIKDMMEKEGMRQFCQQILDQATEWDHVVPENVIQDLKGYIKKYTEVNHYIS